jgi:hypothetical protein
MTPRAQGTGAELSASARGNPASDQWQIRRGDDRVLLRAVHSRPVAGPSIAASLAMALAIVCLQMLLAAPLKATLGAAFISYLLLVVVVVLGFGVMASSWTGPAIEGEELEKDVSQPGEPPAP